MLVTLVYSQLIGKPLMSVGVSACVLKKPLFICSSTSRWDIFMSVIRGSYNHILVSFFFLLTGLFDAFLLTLVLV